MALFEYKAIDQTGAQKNGTIEAVNTDLALRSLQGRGLIVAQINEAKGGKGLKKRIVFFDRIPMKDIVIMSRQLSSLFEAQVSAVKAFTLMAENTDNPSLRNVLSSVSQDVQGGIPISSAMARHPKVFSSFYVSMVQAGEESGKLTDTFLYLSEYLERSHEISSKTRNALVYPAFIIVTFIAVMILMLTLVIPRLSQILLETGQDIPFYTKVVIGISNFFVNYGIFLLIILIVGGFFLWRGSKGPKGKYRMDNLKLRLPYFGDLYNKLYLSRISDNLDTMLSAGIPVVRALDITGDVVDNVVYKEIMDETVESVKSGSTISESMGKREEVPNIMVQMVKVGEETGSLGSILKTLSRFYKREVDSTVDTLIGLIEPALIILLALGVGFLLTSILIPIYNIASGL